MTWFAWSLFSLACWGVWGIFPKLALQGLSWQQVFVIGSASSFAVALGVAAVIRPSFALSPNLALPAVAAGALGTLGVASLYVALSLGGRASVVIPLTAAYPVLTAVLSVLFLREELDPAKLVAVVLFVAATVLVAR